jgi:hypothetical protein
MDLTSDLTQISRAFPCYCRAVGKNRIQRDIKGLVFLFTSVHNLQLHYRFQVQWSLGNPVPGNPDPLVLRRVLGLMWPSTYFQLVIITVFKNNNNNNYYYYYYYTVTGLRKFSFNIKS